MNIDYLSSGYDTASFDCGDSDLNDFLQNDANENKHTKAMYFDMLELE